MVIIDVPASISTGIPVNFENAGPCGALCALARASRIFSWTAGLYLTPLVTCVCGVQIEKFLCLYLDRKNRLIKVVETEGTIDRCPVYPREVLRNALMLNATALILVHNHPSGDPTPSQSDIDITKKIIKCASVMNIAVHDHCIVGDNEVVSLKGLGLM